MNNDQFLIEDFVLEDSQKLCSGIKDKNLRNKSVSNVFAAKAADKYFSDIEIDTKSGLHNVSKVLEDYEISDIYLKGNNYIDVRLFFNDGELFVPKSHYDFNVLPLAYMFIKVDEELDNASVAGFIFPENVDTTNDVSGYYKVDEAELVSFYDLESRLSTLDDVDLPENFEIEIFDYLDGKTKLTQELLVLLTQSKSAREFLYNAFIAKNRFENIVFISSVSQDEKADSDGELMQDSEETGELQVQSPDESFDLLEEAAQEDSIIPIDGLVEDSDVVDLSFAEDDVMMPVDLQEEDSFLEENPLDTAYEQEFQFEEQPVDLLEDSENNLVEQPEITEYEPLQDFADNSEAEEITDSPVEEIAELNESEEKESEITDETSVQSEDIVDLSDFVESEEFVQENVTEEIPATEDSEVEEKALVDEQNDSEMNSLSKFDYSTEITPSIDTIENSVQTVENESGGLTEEMLDSNDSYLSAQEEDAVPNEQIDTLFGQEEENAVNAVNMGKSKKMSPLLPIVLFIVLLGGAGYWAYNNFIISPSANNVPNEPAKIEEQVQSESEQPQEEAMPVETVEKQPELKNTNEGNAVSIPAIEQNLDASILVSNLSVNWEVPANYTSNSTAKRYFVKMGKIIQLNLKTELLLLSKPPITNKIALELEYNKDSHRFGIKQITASSGEKVVDDVIKTTVQNALNINLSMNMSVFETLQGNPVLIIKL